MANRRIKDLTEKTSLASGDYFPIDNNNGTKKVNASKIMTPLTNVQGEVSNNSDAYSTSKAYKVGDYVIYNNVLYKCTSACSAGSWATNSSHFTSTTLATAVTALNSALTNLITKGSFKISVTANTIKIVTSADVLSGTLPTYPLNCSFTTSGSSTNNFSCSIHLEGDGVIRIWSDKTQDMWVHWIQYHY